MEETWYPLYRRLGGPQGWSGWVQKNSPPLGFNPRTAQPVRSHCANYVITWIKGGSFIFSLAESSAQIICKKRSNGGQSMGFCMQNIVNMCNVGSQCWFNTWFVVKALHCAVWHSLLPVSDYLCGFLVKSLGNKCKNWLNQQNIVHNHITNCLC